MEFNRDDLEPAEQELVDALEAGAVYGPESEELDTWPVIRAQTIRDLLRGVYQEVVPDPKGLRLQHVRIDGRIDLDHVDTHLPLVLDRCDMRGGGLTAHRARLPVLLIHGMRIDRPATNEATLNLGDLHVGILRLSWMVLINEKGPALSADGLVAEVASFNENFSATGHGNSGAVGLQNATVGGVLNMRGATLINAAGPALMADGITVGASAHLDGSFTATGLGNLGAVRLIGANIGGDLSFSSATLTNATGPALVADGITVRSNVVLNEGFTVIGEGSGGAARLPHATIGNQLVLSDARFPESVCENPTMLLQGANVRSEIVINSATLKRETASGRWDISGFIYGDLGANPDLWLAFLLKGTDDYSPQPYQQLAAVARARGDEKLTRKILIAQHDDLLVRSREDDSLLTGRQRAALWVLKCTVGYGYRTWRALGWLALIVGLAVVAAFTFGSNGWPWGWGSDWAADALQQPTESKAGSDGAPCRPVDLVILGLETIPLIPLFAGGADRCFVTNSLAGTTFLGISVFLKLTAWALAALFVAGYTNIVRNPGP